MTGQDLLNGLSFVDERFIEEAETAVSYKKVPWMKVLSVAACLCILIVGAFALESIGYKGAREEAAPAAAAPEAMQESVLEAAPAEECATENLTKDTPIPPYAVEEEVASGELQHIPHATLRIVKVLDSGSFEAVVLATQPMEVDTPVTLVIDPSKIPGETREIQNDLSKILADMEVSIEDGAYDAGQNILYAAEVFFTEGE